MKAGNCTPIQPRVSEERLREIREKMFWGFARKVNPPKKTLIKTVGLPPYLIRCY